MFKDLPEGQTHSYPMWKEGFDKEFLTSVERFITLPGREIKAFIETEVIEKLIEEIPDETEHGRNEANPCDIRLDVLKQQLRAKWLGKEME